MFNSPLNKASLRNAGVIIDGFPPYFSGNGENNACSPSVFGIFTETENIKRMIDFSKKELTVLKLVCQDKTNQEIAEKIGLALRSTEKIKTRLYTKTKTRSSLGLFKWAVKNKYFSFKS